MTPGITIASFSVAFFAMMVGAVSIYLQAREARRSRRSNENVEYSLERSLEYVQKYIFDLQRELERKDAQLATRREEDDFDEALSSALENFSRVIEGDRPALSEGVGQSRFERDELLSELSHSLNTPLTQIDVALARTLQGAGSGGLSPTIKSGLERAQASVELCRSVLRTYRSIEDRKSGSDSPSVEARDLHPVIHGIIHACVEKREHSESGFAARPSVYVSHRRRYRDKDRIVSVLVPLIQNAVEGSTRTGKIAVQVLSDPSGDTVVTVSNELDDECTVDIELMNSGEVASTKGAPHSGLGLATVRTLVGTRGEGPIFWTDVDPSRRIFVSVILKPLDLQIDD